METIMCIKCCKEIDECDNELARHYIREIEKAERVKAFNNM